MASVTPDTEQQLLEEALVGGLSDFKSPSLTSSSDTSIPTPNGESPYQSKNKELTTTRASSTYIPLDFADAAEFISFFDPALRTGKRQLHKWQIEELRRLTRKGAYKTSCPLKYLLRAANGSGKDAYIIAAVTAFILCCWPRYKVVITSASDNQLDTQTRNYITYICGNVNDYLKENGVITKAIDIKKETFAANVFKQPDDSKISLTGTEVFTFVAKEGTKVEGYHPYPDAEIEEGVVIIINEAKSVAQEIFEHLEKCTYNIWIEISSPGPARGHFYNVNSLAVEYPAEYIPGKYYLRVISAFDCPHIARSKIELDKIEHGEDSAWYKNTRLAQFSSIGEQVVITEDDLKASIAANPGKLRQDMQPRGGFDIAGSGDDKSALVSAQGNTILYIREFDNIKDTELLLDMVCGTGGDLGLFLQNGLLASNIYADDNGIGESTLNSANRRGWAINRIKNQSKAINTVKYLNRGAELWFTFARLVKEKLINWNGLLTEKSPLFKELTNRHYKQDERLGKIQLLSKKEEKAMGNKSPNMADALVLAFTGITVFDFYKINEAGTKVLVSTPAIPTSVLLNEGKPQARRFEHLFPTIPTPNQTGNGLYRALRSLYD